MHRRELPIRTPCRERELQGLFCTSCQREVFDVERLTAAEVRALRRRAADGERICVRYRVDDQGFIQLRPRPAPARAALVAAGLASLLACGAAQADTTVPTPPAASAPKAPARAQTPLKKPKRAPEPQRKKPDYDFLYGKI
jgi:hypothetical protein